MQTPDARLTASMLAVEALGLSPQGMPWESDTPVPCALEGIPLHRGDLLVPWKPGPNFMDEHDTTRSPVISGHVAALMGKSTMLKTQRMVFCREGAFPIATDAARAWFFLTPPEPPFVAVIADSMLQHLIWRSPVNWSKDLFTFRHGQALRTVNRPRLIEALGVLRDYAGPVFVRLDREGKDLNHGTFRNDVPPEITRHLTGLSPGELVALASLAKRNPPTPERPDAVRLTDQSKKRSTS